MFMALASLGMFMSMLKRRCLQRSGCRMHHSSSQLAVGEVTGFKLLLITHGVGVVSDTMSD